ncbi:MAG: hypothetical protein ACK5Q5_13285 [Planctomycetaceae bacterium]
MPGNEGTPRTDEIWSAVRHLFEGILQEPTARNHLRRFAQELQTALDDGLAGSDDLSDTTLFELPSPSPPPSPAPPVDVVSSTDALKQLKWAQTADSRLSSTERQAASERTEPTAEAPAKSGIWRAVDDAELALIAQRCELKAEACRWKLERRRLIESGRAFAEDVEPRDKDLIARAKSLTDCFLWMNWQDGPLIGANTAWDVLADSFAALGEAVRLLQEAVPCTDDFPDLLKDLMQLTAESQSAVRSGCREVEYEDEPEQDRTYNWLKRTAAERGLYINRFMRVDDPADPTQSADLRERLNELRHRFDARRNQDKVRRKRMGQLKYVASQIREEPDADQSHNWPKVLTAIDDLVEAGEAPSSKEIRKHLLPILDELPAGDLSPHLELVVREIDRYLGENPGEEPPVESTTRVTPAISDVASRLRGRTIVLIGGVRKPGHVAALKDAFQLKDVVWVPTREHQSVSKFEPFVRQPDVALVVLAIRWTSHSYGEVKDFCDQYGKPFVRLKAGYNPTQVAAHILEQVSDQLPVVESQSESA